MVCLNSAKSFASPGFLWIGHGKLTTPLQLLGAQIFIDPNSAGVLVPVVPGPNRLTRVPLGIPMNAPVGAKVHCQFAFAESSCNVPLFTSSGFTLEIQP